MSQIVPDHEDPIILPDGSKIGWLPKSAESYLLMTTNLYGSTKSGKTTCIMESMKLLSNVISRSYIFSGSESSNGIFDGTSPPRSIRTRITVENLLEIYKTCIKRMTIYKLAHTPKHLINILNLLKGRPEYNSVTKALRGIESYCNKMDMYLEDFKSMHPGDLVAINAKVKEISEKKNKATVDILRGQVKANYDALYKICDGADKNTPEALSFKLVRNLDINPNTLVIFDDCMTNLKAVSKRVKVGKETVNIVQDMWTQGRHHGLTIINACQDDAQMEVGLRKNTFLSIFTDRNCLEHYVDTKTNGLGKKLASRMKQAGEFVFNSRDERLRHVKLVYYKNGNEKDNSFIMATKANLYDDIKVGDEAYWNACRLVDERQNKNALDVLRDV